MFLFLSLDDPGERLNCSATEASLIGLLFGLVLVVVVVVVLKRTQNSFTFLKKKALSDSNLIEENNLNFNSNSESAFLLKKGSHRAPAHCGQVELVLFFFFPFEKKNYLLFLNYKELIFIFFIFISMEICFLLVEIL